MLHRFAFALVLALALPGQAQAETDRAPQHTEARETARHEALLEALGIPDLLGIMREEGIAYAAEIEADLFPGKGGSRWPALVARIYNRETMESIMLDRMAEELAPEHLDRLTAFFTSDLGTRIVGLEVSARRAFLEPAVEETSRQALDRMRMNQSTRLELLEVFAEVNDLVEMNVVGALNSNYAFYVGLNAGGAFERNLSEGEMLRDIWRQEDEIREETESWVFSYLAMAYEPLSDGEIGEYIALSRTEDGQALNAGLFAAFDAMFRSVSRDLGMAAAQFMSGEDI